MVTIINLYLRKENLSHYSIKPSRFFLEFTPIKSLVWHKLLMQQKKSYRLTVCTFFHFYLTVIQILNPHEFVFVSWNYIIGITLLYIFILDQIMKSWHETAQPLFHQSDKILKILILNSWKTRANPRCFLFNKSHSIFV